MLHLYEVDLAPQKNTFHNRKVLEIIVSDYTSSEMCKCGAM